MAQANTKSFNDLGAYVRVGKVSADNGDASATLTVGVSDPVQIWDTPLTTPRTVTLNTAGAYEGAVFKIVRTAAATGASALNVGPGPLKAQAVGRVVEVTFDGTAWFVTNLGFL